MICSENVDMSKGEMGEFCGKYLVDKTAEFLQNLLELAAYWEFVKYKVVLVPHFGDAHVCYAQQAKSDIII